MGGEEVGVGGERGHEGLAGRGGVLFNVRGKCVGGTWEVASNNGEGGQEQWMLRVSEGRERGAV